MALLTLLLAAVHALTGAAWLGAMIYSLTVLQPRAIRFFDGPERFEEFITVVSHGARRKVLAVFAITAVTGLGLVLLRPGPVSAVWVVLVVLKTVLLVASLVLFVYVSWRMWPARVLALPEEIPGLQRQFRRAGLTMIALVGLNFLLGILAQRL
jgi:hypothetical protein